MKNPGTLKDGFGFTLIEIMVVVIIIGILASLAVPNYLNTKEKSFDTEAKTVLKLIRVANKQYFAKNSFYFRNGGPETSLPYINGNLSLDLNSSSWTFSVTGGGTMTATAVRIGGGRTWTITQSPADPTCSGTCL